MSKRDFLIDNKHVKSVMDFNKVSEVLVTSAGHVYLMKAESFCKAECIRTSTKYAVVTESELLEEKPAKAAKKVEKSLEEMSINELKAFAKTNNIEASGKTPEVLASIQAELAKRAAEEKEANKDNVATKTVE